MKSASERPEDELAVLRPYRFGADPRQEQTRQVAVGQFVVDPGAHPERVRSVAADVLFLVAGVGARQAAQCEQPRHEAKIGVGFARLNELVDLVETGEVVQRLGHGWRQGATVGQRDRPGDIAEGNESAALVAAMIFCAHRHTSCHAASCFPIHSRSAASIRVCQPRPPALK